MKNRTKQNISGFENIKPLFYWNEDTINHFEFISSYATVNEVYNMIKEFVELDCQLEDGETEQDLIMDLMSKIYPRKIMKL